MTNKTKIRHYHLMYGDEGYLPTGNEILNKDIDIKSVIRDEIIKIKYSQNETTGEIFYSKNKIIKDIFTSKDDYSDGVKVTINRDLVSVDYMEITPCILSEELCPGDEE